MKVPHFLLLSALFLLASCVDETMTTLTDDDSDDSSSPLTVSVEKIAFLKSAGSETVTIHATDSWSALVTTESATNWLTVDPAMGRRNATVTVSVAKNTTGAVRRGTITVSLLYQDEEVTQDIIVAQSASDSEPSDSYTLPYRVDTLFVPVDDTVQAYLLGDTDADWINYLEDYSDSTQVAILLDDNDDDLPREGTLTLESAEGLKRYISFYQYGAPNPRIGDDARVTPLAFPGAEGGGRFTTGGRGGTVYHVTSLEDYTADEDAIEGTLRYGLDQDGAKIIVFDVGGYIELKRSMQIVKSDFSIIGQTAPGDGITLRNYDMSIRYGTDNGIIRFIRVRTGEQSGEENDALTGRWFKQGIVDHVSGSWCIDECISFYGVQDFTLQWSIAAESLNNSIHSKGAHGYGAMFSGDNASCHHFLIMHHSSRTPRISALQEGLVDPDNELDNMGYSDLRNMVIYNWSGYGQGCYGGEYNPFNMVNNYYKAGPATGTTAKSWRIVQASETSRIYADGNVATANELTYTDNWTYGIWDQVSFTDEEEADMKVDEPHPFSLVTTHSAEDAYEKVAAYAGCSLHRDAVDERYIEELTGGTVTYYGSVSGLAGIIDTTDDVGGYPDLDEGETVVDTDRDGIPDLWEWAYGLDPDDPDDAALYTIDELRRYSNLEVYFHNLVQHIVYYQNLGGEEMSCEE